MPTSAPPFLRHLRNALNHLYHSDYLRQSPLAFLLGVAARPDTSSALSRILTEAIESLKPAATISPNARAWRIYDLLLYRYVQQFSQQEVADQLGLSLRHLRREQHAATEALADRLREQFHLPLDTEQRVDEKQSSVHATAAATVNHELAWLKEPSLEGPTVLEQTLPAALDLTRPLSTRHQVHLDVALADALPGLAIHPVALRQILLNLLGVAIHRGAGSRVRVSTKPLRWEAEIEISCGSPASLLPPSRDDLASLDMARRLADFSGCELTVSEKDDTFVARLTIPAFEQFPVLVIDDNADTLQLLHRYAAGTRYRLVGTPDPQQAFSIAEKLSPQIIILDVMMPSIDGWEMLGRLRQHPLTSHIPIIVYTILAQEELALSLGASAFAQKPITQQAFLAVLDRQVVQREREPG
ncbi:MAG: hybrid sensor histidine kinase/response regulator [Anaerolineae bacterium]|nr:hybrid sensor histidine kinase/response regulator [Anaerolineae bacterium]